MRWAVGGQIEHTAYHLPRAFGFGDTGDLDPFLLFDDFRNQASRPSPVSSRVP
jgi:hypothetical protein